MPKNSKGQIKIVRELNDKHKVLLMIGDGLNDTPVLKSSSIEIAMEKIGIDATIEKSNVTLIEDEINKLMVLLQLIVRALKSIKKNISISKCINFTFVLLALLNLATMWWDNFCRYGYYNNCYIE